MVSSFTNLELTSIVDFSQRKFTGNTFLSNATNEEKNLLGIVNKKLRGWAENIAAIYGGDYGPFEIGFPTGNPVQYNSPKIKVPWAGVFKGNTNKQYSAQVSIVINPYKPCIDVGFYFGAMASHDLSKPERLVQESKLQTLGLYLANLLNSQDFMRTRYNDLFQFEFLPYINDNVVTEGDWISTISSSVAGCSIKASIFPDQLGEVTFPTVDSYISQLMFLMLGIIPQSSIELTTPPLTPQQWAKQAERRAIIGFRGEEYIMKVETTKLASYNDLAAKYPRHVALESNHYGYDILSYDPILKHEILIEVKTTAQIKQAGTKDIFFMSTNEYNQYLKNSTTYRLYRVYNIEIEPSYNEVDLGCIKPEPDGFVFQLI